MDIEAATELIYQRFKTAWSGTAGTDYTFENDVFRPPQGAWARLSVRTQGTEQETLGPAGSRRYRYLGAANIELFVPVNTGVRVLRGLTADAQAVFAGVSLGDGLKFFGGPTPLERAPEDKWVSALVTTTFEFYETR